MWLADVPDHTIVVIVLPDSHVTFLAYDHRPSIEREMTTAEWCARANDHVPSPGVGS